MLITDDVGVYDKPIIEDRMIHTALQTEKKVNKVLKLDGIEKKKDLGNVKRIRKQTQILNM